MDSLTLAKVEDVPGGKDRQSVQSDRGKKVRCLRGLVCHHSVWLTGECKGETGGK